MGNHCSFFNDKDIRKHLRLELEKCKKLLFSLKIKLKTSLPNSSIVNDGSGGIDVVCDGKTGKLHNFLNELEVGEICNSHGFYYSEIGRCYFNIVELLKIVLDSEQNL
jgi:hypothetical protein